MIYDKYRMKAIVLKRISNSLEKDKVVCYCCGKEILRGQLVRKLRRGKIYHSECFERLFLDL
jgi:hypothetical protein